MSWEESFRREYPCPCGKGRYEYVSYSDDWGRGEIKYEMLCPECERRYHLEWRGYKPWDQWQVWVLNPHPP